MSRRPKGEPPRPRRHATGQAFCRYRGKDHYFGVFGTDEAHAGYSEFLEAWRADQREAAGPLRLKAGCTVADLCAAFMRHAEEWYRRDDGSRTPEFTDMKALTQLLIDRHGVTRADDFTADALKELRDGWVQQGHRRQTVNKNVRRVRHVFKWGKEEGLVKPATLAELQFRDLPAGRTRAKEYDEVLPAPEADVRRARLHMGPRVRAMTELQELVGARPGEICRLRGAEVHQGGRVRVGGREVEFGAGVWVFTPAQHKNLRKGKFLAYAVGPKAQKVLRRWLRADPEEYLFQPGEEERDRRSALKKPGNPPKKKKPNRKPHRRCYTSDVYGKAVKRACEAAGVPVWQPNQLRHLWFSRADRAAGIHTASTAGGHSSLDTTAIYVERRLKEAADLARRIG